MELTTEHTKTTQVAELIGNSIRSGKIKAGSRLQSIRSLARQFSVSNKVVEKAFEILNEQRVVDSYVGRGTFVRANIYIDKARKIRRFAVITYYGSEMFDSYFNSLKEELDIAGNAFLYARYDPAHYRHSDKSLENVLSMDPDVFIIDQPSIAVYKSIQPLIDRKPCCLVHEQQNPNAFDCPAFFIDKISMYAEGLKYLLDKGHRRVLTLGFSSSPGPIQSLTSEYRLLHDGAVRLGLNFDHEKIPYAGHEDFEKNFLRLSELFTSADPPTAVFGMSDHIVYQFMGEMARRFPAHRISECLGVYNTPWSDQPGQEFHSFEMNFKTMWREAIRHMNSENSSEKIISWIQPRLIIRKQGENK